jgi:hypothetical protein
MEPSINSYIWQQFGAAIDMLENAIIACTPELWNDGSRFWYLGFHTIYWTDYYLSDQTPKESDFMPPAPFTRSEFEYDAMPDRVYDKEELLQYLAYARQKLRDQLTRISSEELLTKRFISEYKEFTLFELLLYNMRHVQHHAAQLNQLLRQSIHDAPKWVSRTEGKLY